MNGYTFYEPERYYSVAGANTPETAEERSKRLMDHEIERRENEKRQHQHTMDRERQTQDYELAMRARLAVAWVVGVAIVALTAAGTILGGIWMSR